MIGLIQRLLNVGLRCKIVCKCIYVVRIILVDIRDVVLGTRTRTRTRTQSTRTRLVLVASVLVLVVEVLVYYVISEQDT